MTYRGDGDTVTVRWEDCVAVERRLDGSVAFFRRDEGWLKLVPDSWEHGDAALEEAFERLPPGRLLTEIEAETFERVMAAGAAGLPERGELSAELGALARELGVGETPLALVAAISGTSLGLLVVTDARLLWLRESGDDPQRQIWSWTSLIAVEAGTLSVLHVIVREQGTEKFVIQPGRRTTEIAEWATRQIG